MFRHIYEYITSLYDDISWVYLEIVNWSNIIHSIIDKSSSWRPFQKRKLIYNVGYGLMYRKPLALTAIVYNIIRDASLKATSSLTSSLSFLYVWFRLRDAYARDQLYPSSKRCSFIDSTALSHDNYGSRRYSSNSCKKKYIQDGHNSIANNVCSASTTNHLKWCTYTYTIGTYFQHYC